MSETRRQVFRTSILSALGLATAAGVAGCGSAKPSISLNTLFGGPPASVTKPELEKFDFLVKTNEQGWVLFEYNHSWLSGAYYYLYYPTNGTSCSSFDINKKPDIVKFAACPLTVVGASVSWTIADLPAVSFKTEADGRFTSSDLSKLKENMGVNQGAWNEVGKL